jgi:hypothetical protein
VDQRDAGSGDPAYSLPDAAKDAVAGKHGEYEMVLFLLSAFCISQLTLLGTAPTEAGGINR